MNVDIKLGGATAVVFLASEVDLKSLASQLGSDLFGVEFYIDTDIDPPHAEVAMCEALGFEVWLNHSTKIDGYNYELKLETSHCHEALMENRMCDLSPWLTKYLSEIGNIKVWSSSST